MATAKFKGVTLPFAHTRQGGWGYANKEIAYPGVDGVEFLNMGQRGRVATITGRLTAVSGGAVSKAQLIALHNNTTGYLTFSDGTSWTGTVITKQDFTGFYKDGTTNALACQYTMTFRQLGE